MQDKELLERIHLLEYHQSLMLQMLSASHHDFFKVVIAKKLTQKQVDAFFALCEEMSNQLEEQKAEGFVYFHPLFRKFQSELPQNLQTQEVIKACLNQGLFLPLMNEFKKYD